MPVTIEKKSKTGQVVRKAYETVAERVRKFRAVCPVQVGWGLTTEISFPSDGVVLAIAKITTPDGIIVATGTAEEKRDGSYINKSSAVENSETSAVGRCLFAAGFGGGEYCSAEELLTALKQQDKIKATELKVINGTGGAKDGVKKQPASPPASSRQSSGDLPRLDGITYQRKANTIIAEGNTFAVKGLLKNAGFQWNPELKAWAMEVKNA